MRSLYENKKRNKLKKKTLFNFTLKVVETGYFLRNLNDFFLFCKCARNNFYFVTIFVADCTKEVKQRWFHENSRALTSLVTVLFLFSTPISFPSISKLHNNDFHISKHLSKRLRISYVLRNSASLYGIF